MESRGSSTRGAEGRTTREGEAGGPGARDARFGVIERMADLDGLGAGVCICARCGRLFGGVQLYAHFEVNACGPLHE